MGLFGRKKNAEVESEESPEPPVLEGAPASDAPRSIDDHRDFLLGLVEPLPPFGMQLLDAVGLAVWEDLTVADPLPTVDMAKIEGYAVRAADTTSASDDAPVVLRWAGSLGVGQEATNDIPETSCVQVVATAPLPAGTDAVVALDKAEFDGDQVTVREPVHPGKGVRPQGSDLAAGAALLREGEKFTARMAGQAAAAGIDRVMARPRPRVVVLSAGAHLVDPSQPLTSATSTHDANSFLLAAAARAEGAEVFRVGIYTDDERELREAITDQLIRADLLITTGGLSSRGFDLVRTVIADLGRTDFTDVAMTPGTHQGVGVVGLDDVPVVMLPGSPLGAYVSFHVFVRPLIRHLMGTRPSTPPMAHAVTTQLIRPRTDAVRWIRGITTDERGGRHMVEPLQDESAHQLGDLTRANCLIRIDPAEDAIPAGVRVPVLMLDHE